MDTSLSHDAYGLVSLSEAKERAPDSWEITDLVTDAADTVSFLVERIDDSACVAIEISAMRIQHGTETDQTFNAHLRVFLDRPSLAQLHAYLGFLLAAG